MKTNDMPPTVRKLFMQYSKAKVIKPSRKQFITPTGELSRIMNNSDALYAHAQKYAHNR